MMFHFLLTLSEKLVNLLTGIITLRGLRGVSVETPQWIFYCEFFFKYIIT